MAKVAFLGLGVMGYPMARHLKAKGHEVTVYNRTAAKAEQWVSENGGRAVPEGFVYASDTNDRWLSVEELRRLVEGDGDLVRTVPASVNGHAAAV